MNNELTRIQFGQKRQAVEMEQIRGQIKFMLEKLKALESKIDAYKPKANDTGAEQQRLGPDQKGCPVETGESAAYAGE